MEMLMNLKKAIDLMEDRMEGRLDIEELAKAAYMSPFHFQRMFHMLTGMTVAEYARKRKLTLAAQELAAASAKVVDVALKYGYDSPATGFAVDVESLLSTSKKDREGNQIHFVVIPKKPALRREAIRLAEWLRSSGFKVVLDLNLDAGQREMRIRENRDSNFYGVILLETPMKLKLIESRRGACKEFSNLEELLKGGI